MSNCPTCNAICISNEIKELERQSKLTPEELDYEKIVAEAQASYTIEEEKARIASMSLRDQRLRECEIEVKTMEETILIPAKKF